MSKRFFTGQPCKYGHVTERFISNRECVECHRLRREASREYRKEYDAKRDHSAVYQKYRARYIEKAMRRNGKLRMSSFPHEREKMKEFYAQCPEGYEVDHVVPIVHPEVCGLHTLANLQYLPMVENRRKSNVWIQE